MTEPTCPLCGNPCEQIEVWGAKLNGCPCVRRDRMVAIDLSKLTKDPESSGYNYELETVTPEYRREYLGEWVTPRAPIDPALVDRMMADNNRFIAEQTDRQRINRDRMIYGTGYGRLRADGTIEHIPADEVVTEHLTAVVEQVAERDASAQWERRIAGTWYPCDERGIPYDQYLPYGTEPIAGNLRLKVTEEPPRTRAGQLEDVLYAAQIGCISTEQARELIDELDPTPIDPLDVEYDGMTLRRLLERDRKERQDEWGGRTDMTPLHRSAISAHWSAELRAKVAASKERELRMVTGEVDE